MTTFIYTYETDIDTGQIDADAMAEALLDLSDQDAFNVWEISSPKLVSVVPKKDK